MIATMSRAGSRGATLNSYSTTFAATENPISEGGRWTNGGTVGLDWTNMRSTTNFAYGLQVDGGFYTDGTAILTGSWAADQAASATVKITGDPSQGGTLYSELELRLRSVVTAHVNRGIEFMYSCRTQSNAYLGIVRWNGPVTSFDVLVETVGLGWNVVDGDVMSATAVGNVYTLYRNGIAMLSATDDTWTDGNPGIGHNSTEVGGAHNNLYGFSAFSAVDL